MIEAVNEICRLYRKKNNITLYEMGIKTGYTPANISKFERGKVNNERLLLCYITMFPRMINDIMEVLPL